MVLLQEIYYIREEVLATSRIIIAYRSCQHYSCLQTLPILLLLTDPADIIIAYRSCRHYYCLQILQTLLLLTDPADFVAVQMQNLADTPYKNVGPMRSILCSIEFVKQAIITYLLHRREFCGRMTCCFLHNP